MKVKTNFMGNETKINANVIALKEGGKGKTLDSYLIEKDNYIKKNIESKFLVKLWENPNPSAEIGGSGYTITLNSDDYDYLVLIYATATDCLYMKSTMALKGQGFCLDYVDSFWTGSSYSGPVGRRRYINYVDDTTLNAQGSEYFQQGLAVYQQPGSNIPIAIYGGKF